MNRPPPTCHRTTPHRPLGSVPEDQQPGTNVGIPAGPSSARMPTYIDTNPEPVLSVLYLLILLSSLRSMYGVPLGTQQPDRSLPFVRDFRPLIAALGDRRLHGRFRLHERRRTAASSPLRIGHQRCPFPKLKIRKTLDGLRQIHPEPPWGGGLPPGQALHRNDSIQT